MASFRENRLIWKAPNKPQNNPKKAPKVSSSQENPSEQSVKKVEGIQGKDPALLKKAISNSKDKKQEQGKEGRGSRAHLLEAVDEGPLTKERFADAQAWLVSNNTKLKVSGSDLLPYVIERRGRPTTDEFHNQFSDPYEIDWDRFNKDRGRGKAESAAKSGSADTEQSGDKPKTEQESENPQDAQEESGEAVTEEKEESEQNEKQENIFVVLLTLILELANRMRNGGLINFNVQEYALNRDIRKQMESIQVRLSMIGGELLNPNTTKERRLQLEESQEKLEKQYKDLEKELEEHKKRQEEQRQNQETEDSEESITEEQEAYRPGGRQKGSQQERRRNRPEISPRNDAERAMVEFVERFQNGEQIDLREIKHLMVGLLETMTPEDRVRAVRDVARGMNDYVEQFNSYYDNLPEETLEKLSVSRNEAKRDAVRDLVEGGKEALEIFNEAFAELGMEHRLVIDKKGVVSVRRAEEGEYIPKRKRGGKSKKRAKGGQRQGQSQGVTVNVGSPFEYSHGVESGHERSPEDIFAPLMALREDMEGIKGDRKSARSRYESENRGLAKDFRRRGQNPGSQFWQGRKDAITSKMGGELSLKPITGEYWTLRRQCERKAKMSFPMFLRMQEGYRPAHDILTSEDQEEKVVIKDGSGKTLAIYSPWTGNFTGSGVSKRQAEEMYAAGNGSKSGSERTIVMGRDTETGGSGRGSRVEMASVSPSEDYVEFIPATEFYKNGIVPVTVPAAIMEKIRMGNREHVLLIKQVSKGKFEVPRTLRDVRFLPSFSPERWSTDPSVDQMIAEKLGLRINNMGGGVEIIIPGKWVWDGSNGEYNDGPPMKMNGSKVVSSRLRNSPYFNS